MRSLLLIAVGVLGCCLTNAQPQSPAPCLSKSVEARPYDTGRLLEVAQAQTPTRAAYLIRTCGVRAAFTPELEKRLRDAGAAEAVLNAVRDVAPKAATTGRVFVNPKDGLPYVFVPPGVFVMGCVQESQPGEPETGDGLCRPDEKPAHEVAITKGFRLGQTEVTVGAYKKFANATGHSMPPELGAMNPGWSHDEQPVNKVTWSEASAFCDWAGGALPTEAQWEYAARAATEPRAARYGPVDEIAWYGGNAGTKIHPVAKKTPNAFGLYDMLGNVWEWTADYYSEKYASEERSVDPSGPQQGAARVIRGGSFGNAAHYLRSSYRLGYSPRVRWHYIGFRCRL